MISVGNLDTPVIIEKPTYSANANYGGIQDTSWSNATGGDSSVWAYMVWRGGNEREDADQMTGKTVVDFYIRYETFKDLIYPNWRIRHNLNAGGEILINPNFDDSIAIGTAGSGWAATVTGSSTITYDSSAGVILNNAGGSYEDCILEARDGSNGANILTVGKFYEVRYEVTALTNGPVLQYYNGAAYSTIASTIGTHSFRYYQTTSQVFRFKNLKDTTSITVKSISIKEIAQSEFYIEKIAHIDGRHKMTKLTASSKDNN
tara:strand:- start:7103 stop:7885 length:783 start_codon:yes stop_codon:yes gene_type:complete